MSNAGLKALGPRVLPRVPRVGSCHDLRGAGLGAADTGQLTIACLKGRVASLRRVYPARWFDPRRSGPTGLVPKTAAAQHLTRG